ncbi:uncharacterized protein LOC103382581 [Cynoglossus semilaevis]|uniref:uncharacterized protein LOC103382581 n=1 Tax=Cynoglossus semilaevis TaxID=244447 RepID=UPI0007DCA14C|nr:uncharacterized protein LOC103382581 [Cynoglossus semilaevis]
MKIPVDHLRPLRLHSSTYRPHPPPNNPVPPALQGQELEGYFHLDPQRRGNNNVETKNLIAGNSSAAAAAAAAAAEVAASAVDDVVPCPSPADSPAPPIIIPSALQSDNPHSEKEKPKPEEDTQSPSSSPFHLFSPERHEPQEDGKVPQEVPAMSVPGLEGAPFRGPAGWELLSTTTPLSQESLSDFSRPPSSLFSRSTDLSGRSSNFSGLCSDSDPELSDQSHQHQPSSGLQLPQTSASTLRTIPQQSFTNNFTSKSPLCEPVFDQIQHPSSRPSSHLQPVLDKPPSRHHGIIKEDNYNQDVFTEPVPDSSLVSDQGHLPLALTSATWSSCPSPQRSTPRSREKLNPSPPPGVLQSQCWSVLPPITPFKGRSGSAASRFSEVSCSQSYVFDELEAIAPTSTCCPSLDEASDSSVCSSPETDLSPGLAALTVGCDSGKLEPLSRVQLLLLDRAEPEMLPGHCGMEEEEEEREEEEELMSMEDWEVLRKRYNTGQTTGVVMRPLTAGGVSERCHSAGKVQDNKSDWSDGGSGSPSSWIIDPSPSSDMFRSSLSPDSSNHNKDGPAEEGPNYPGHSDDTESSDPGRSPEGLEEERRMEERRTIALDMLSKLQDDQPRRSKGTKGCFTFEDFDFLAKYCIFSEDKLEEYRQVFEAEDTDADGYISSLQVVLGLKNVVPPELLSEEEEIYVYRILEMVDFRVTDGLVDLRLFSVIASLAQKIATMDDFMRSLISSTDFRSLEVRLFKAKQLFLFLLEEQRGDSATPQRGFISAEQLLLELKAGGIRLEQEASVRLELQRLPPLDLLDFLAYLPLFMLIHKSVIANPLDDSCTS